MDSDFYFFPGKAFEHILQYPENSHLKKGFYVSKRKLVLDDAVRNALNNIGSGFPNHILDGNDISGLNYDTAEKLVKELGGRMLAPASFLCAYNYLKTQETAEAEEILEDFTRDQEFLEGRVCKDRPRYLYVSDSAVRPIPKIAERKSGYFYLSDIDPETGFPKRIRKNGSFYYYCPTIEAVAVIRSSADFKILAGDYEIKRNEKNKDKFIVGGTGYVPDYSTAKISIGADLPLSYSSPKLKVRICKKVE